MNTEPETLEPITPEQAEAHVRGVLDKHLKPGVIDEVMARKFQDSESLNDLIASNPRRAIELAEEMFDWDGVNRG